MAGMEMEDSVETVSGMSLSAEWRAGSISGPPSLASGDSGCWGGTSFNEF